MQGKHNQKTHANKYGGYQAAKESLRRLKDDKLEREKYKDRARKKQGRQGKGKGVTTKPKEPAGAKVSSALDTAELPKSGKIGPQVRETLDVIDKVHGDGNLPTIPIKTNSTTTMEGVYTILNNQPKDIKVSTKGSHPMITTAHEVGHFLDHQGGIPIGTPDVTIGGYRRSKWGSVGDMPEMKGVMDAAKKSRAVNELINMRGKEIEIDHGGLTLTYRVDSGHIDYLLDKKETFARAYSQYVTKKSGNPKMLAELNSLRDRKNGRVYYPQQWEDDDFVPIEKEMDNLFGSLGWIQ